MSPRAVKLARDPSWPGADSRPLDDLRAAPHVRMERGLLSPRPAVFALWALGAFAGCRRPKSLTAKGVCDSPHSGQWLRTIVAKHLRWGQKMRPFFFHTRCVSFARSIRFDSSRSSPQSDSGSQRLTCAGLFRGSGELFSCAPHLMTGRSSPSRLATRDGMLDRRHRRNQSRGRTAGLDGPASRRNAR